MDISWFHVIIIFGELFLGFCKPKFILFFFPIIFKFSPTPPNPPPPLFIYLFFTRGAGRRAGAGGQETLGARQQSADSRPRRARLLPRSGSDGGRTERWGSHSAREEAGKTII